jgi:hypothetical protein
MTDTNEGTAPEGGEDQSTEETPVAGTPVKDEVTTLKSRNAGLDAKVTSLIAAAAVAEQKAADAAKKLADYEAGTVGSDEALRAQLQAKEAELATARQETALARIEAKYPETFGLFGAHAATMAEDVLAASEARLKGVAGEDDENPAPVGNNASRTTGGATAAKAKGQQTIAELEAEFKKLTPPWLTG